jgi:hypothetical protein
MGTDIHSVGQVKKNGEWVTRATSPGGDDRNYDTFAVLADVRNGSGFAGVETGEGWKVFFEARGLPEDIAVDQDNYHGGEWLGDHTHSYLTLKELKKIASYFEEKTYERRGMITKEQEKELKKGTLPNSWCGWTNTAGWVQAKWSVPALESLCLLTKIIEALEEMKSDYDIKKDDEVRLVFGFDS